MPARITGRIGQNIKINMGHKARATLKALGFFRVFQDDWLFNKYCTNSDTGRPVAPLAPPDFQAVPAISKCAQGKFFAKRDKKQAAVILPPSRPPIFAISAKLLSSCF